MEEHRPPLWRRVHPPPLRNESRIVSLRVDYFLAGMWHLANGIRGATALLLRQPKIHSQPKQKEGDQKKAITSGPVVQP